MCLFPKLIKNPKYRPNKKNKGIVPHMVDNRVGYVPIGCGWCMECMQKKANEWKVRLSEDIKDYDEIKFITLTLSNESYKELSEAVEAKDGYLMDNQIATLAVRRFLERWRKEHKKSLRHWLITELGGNGTENVHLHGIVYTNDLDKVERIWKYGFIWKGKKVGNEIINYVSDRTINYMTKYVMKADPKHKAYKPKILCSPGIGSGYTKRPNFKRNKYNEEETEDYYVTKTGHKVALPIYYRNKAFTEEEREKLWLMKLDENVRYVGGEKVRADDDETYWELLKFYRRKNRRFGYGSPENWDVKKYEEQRRRILQQTRIRKAKLKRRTERKG